MDVDADVCRCKMQMMYGISMQMQTWMWMQMLYISHAQHHMECSICAYSIKALTIGYNLSVGPIFLLTEFNQNVSIIGILFAAGASCGTISAVSATLTKPGKWFFNKYLPVCACRICQPCVCACVLASCASCLV